MRKVVEFTEMNTKELEEEFLSCYGHRIIFEDLDIETITAIRDMCTSNDLLVEIDTHILKWLNEYVHEEAVILEIT